MNKFTKLLGVFGVGIALCAYVPQSFAANLAAHFRGANVTVINGTSLIVSLKSHTYTIATDNNTKVIRRFGAASSLGQISVGDLINVSGTWTDATKNTVNAKLIRDGSIQERHDTFSGSVISVTGTGFLLQSAKRGQQTVIAGSNTKIIDRKGHTLSISSIVANDKVRVDGLWDRTSKTITATTIRDISQPAKIAKPTGSK